MVFAALIFRKEPFILGNSNSHLLQAIARVLGTQGLLNYVEKYDIETDPDGVDAIPYYEKRNWESFFSEGNERYRSDEAVDLLDRLLRWDHQVR